MSVNVGLALPAEKNRIGVAIVVADEIVGQHASRRDFGEDRVQAQRAHENRLEIGHSPFAQLGLHCRRRVLHQVSGETLELDSGVRRTRAGVRHGRAIVQSSGPGPCPHRTTCGFRSSGLRAATCRDPPWCARPVGSNPCSIKLARELSTSLSGPAASANGWRIRGGNFRVEFATVGLLGLVCMAFGEPSMPN